MAENKTKATEDSVAAYLDSVEPEGRREDARKVDALMQRVTGAMPKMWSGSIVGYGDAHLTYESGRELDWFKVGFAPRKANLVLYLGLGGTQAAPLLDRLGKHKTGKGCLYVNRLSDIDLDVLEDIVRQSAGRQHANGA